LISEAQRTAVTLSVDAVLAVDVGATNLRMSGCLFDQSRGGMMVLWTETHTAGSEDNLRNFMAGGIERLLSTPGIQHVSLATAGIPGIVTPDRQTASITYLDPARPLPIARWLQEAGVERVILYNDVESGCCGIGVVAPDRFVTLQGDLSGGVPDTFMVGMPGTGLGVGYWMHGEPHPSEGGHGLIAVVPQDPIETLIWDGINRQKAGSMPVYDDIACGKGLGPLARILAGAPEFRLSLGGPMPELDSIPDKDLPGKLSEWANDESARHRDFARAVFRRFGTFLGRGLQLPVLTVMPRALFLAGTIAAANLPWFQDEFLRAFRTHRYHSAWLKALPIALATDPDLNLKGAIEAARRELIGQGNMSGSQGS